MDELEAYEAYAEAYERERRRRHPEEFVAHGMTCASIQPSAVYALLHEGEPLPRCTCGAIKHVRED